MKQIVLIIMILCFAVSVQAQEYTMTKVSDAEAAVMQDGKVVVEAKNARYSYPAYADAIDKDGKEVVIIAHIRVIEEEQVDNNITEAQAMKAAIAVIQ